MKIMPKFLILFFVTTLFTAAVAGTSLWGLQGLFATADRIFARDMKINSHANKLRIELARLRQIEKEFFLFPDSPSRQGKYIILWNNQHSAIFEDVLFVLEEPLRSNNDTRKLSMLARARELMAENMQEWQRVTKKFGKIKSFDEADIAEYGMFKRRMKELADIAAEMAESSAADLQEGRDVLQATRGTIELIIKVTLVLAVLWGVGVPCLLARNLSDAIGKITLMADRLSFGRVTGNLEVERRDELGDLATSVSRIQKSMRILLARLKQAG